MARKTKKCPYCGEEILAVAKKCRFCGEFLDSSTRSKEISKEKAEKEVHVIQKGNPLSGGSVLLWVIAIIILIIFIVFFGGCVGILSSC